VSGSVALVTVALGFGLIIVAGSWLGAGSHLPLAGLFPLQGRDDWPHGVQEGDAPHFAVEHADALRPGSPGAADERPRNPASVAQDDAADPPPEVVELYTRRLGPLAPLVPLAPLAPRLPR
jgi:hypothetical protein